MKTFATALLLTAACWLSLPVWAQATTPPDPHTVIEQTSRQIMEAMQGPAGESRAEMEKVLEGLLVPVVDFPAIAKAVMGKYYKLATPAQQQQFANTLQQSMISLYAKILLNFSISSLEVEPAPVTGDPFKGVVSMKVTSADGKVYTMAYSMRQSPDKGWQVRNVVLDGINLGLTYRNQFNSAAMNAQGNLGQVIADWGKQMDTVAAANPR